LQDRRALASFEPRQQLNATVGKLDRIVMHIRIVNVDLAESPDFVRDNPCVFVEKGCLKPIMMPQDILFKDKFGAGQKANRNRGFLRR
jgi:hypothetical protein